MCRLAAYLGPDRPLSDVIVAPSHSLLVQSQEAAEAKLSVNGDGFGIAWYGQKSEPGLFKDVLPAWSDSNLLSLCEHISSRLFLAHVRASTEGETARANCHPFTYKNWSFMHNGQTGSFSKLRRSLEQTLPDDLYDLRKGSTDSELIFLLLIDAGLETDPSKACDRVIELMKRASQDADVMPFFRMTCLMSDGETLFGFRYASDGRCPTLYMSDGFLDGGLVVASERLGGIEEDWDEIVPNRLVQFKRRKNMTSTDLVAA